MNQQLERILPRVQKPARYVGGEYGEIVKNKEDVRLRVAFCFPDTYEIGMSNVGMRILYGVMKWTASGASASLLRGAIWRKKCGEQESLCMRWRVRIRFVILIW